MLATARLPAAGTVERSGPAATGGEKVTVTVQLWPEASAEQSFDCENCALSGVTEPTVTAVAPMFVSVNVWAGDVVAIDCPPKSSDTGFGNSVGDAAAVTKRAPTVFAAFAVTEHAPVPEHAPDQPMKTDPASATAARLTDVPALKLDVHVAPQATPAGVEVMVPAPVPDFATVTGYVTTDADLMQLAGERVSVPLARTNDVQAVEVVVPSVTWDTCAMTGERPRSSHAPASARAQRPIRFILTFPMCVSPAKDAAGLR